MKLLLLFMLCSFGLFAENVSIVNVSVNGKIAEEPAVFKELLKSSIQELGDYTIVQDSAKAKIKLQLKVLKLGNSYIAQLSLMEGAKTLKAAKLKAGSIDDMDKVIDRLTRAMLKGKSKKANVGEVTKEESERESHRVKAIKRKYLGFGPAAGSNLSGGSKMVNISLGYFIDVNPRASIRLFWDGTYATEDHNDADFSNWGIGVGYHLFESDISPFATIDLGYGSAEKDGNAAEDDRQADSFTLGIGIGYKFFRTSTTNLEVLLRAQTLFEEFKDGGESPSTIALRIGVLF